MFILSLISFIVVFSVVVLVHELGHYFVAKRNGVKIEEFALGLPPKAFTLWKNKSGTNFILNYIPFGGYVKMYGENNKEVKSKKGAFISLNKIQRFQVIVAGVVMNFIFSIFILTIVYTLGSRPIILSEQDFDSYKKSGIIEMESFEGVKILEFSKDSEGMKSGLMIGDNILKINGVKINKESFTAFNKQGGDLNYELLRGDKIINLNVKTNKEGMIGAYITDKPLIKNINKISFSFIQSIIYSLKQSLRISILTVQTFGDMVVNIITKQSIPDGVSGPIGMAKMSGLVAQEGNIDEIFKFMALISLSLAIINILPIPALDGGHLLLLFIEVFIGKKILSKFSGWFNLIGLIFLLSLMIIISIGDVFNLIK